MQFDKQQILEMLRSHGSSEQVTQAEQELPDQVDTEQHSDLLGKLGINPQELLGKLGGSGLGGWGAWAASWGSRPPAVGWGAALQVPHGYRVTA